MKLVPLSLSRSSYVPSSFRFYIVTLVSVFYLCPSSVCVVATFPGTVLFPLLYYVLPFFPLIHWFFSLSSFVIPRRCLKNFICAASKRCSSLFFSCWLWSVRPDRPQPTTLLPPRSNSKPEAATVVYKLLMMVMRMAETCWAVFKRLAVNLRDWCIWLVWFIWIINITLILQILKILHFSSSWIFNSPTPKSWQNLKNSCPCTGAAKLRGPVFNLLSEKFWINKFI